MIILRRAGKDRCYIVSIAIGGEYYSNWKKIISPTWMDYCDRHDIGLILITENLLSENDPNYKKPNWQKLLIPDFLGSNSLEYNSLCYLDTDIIPGLYAPNIFEFHTPGKIEMVSKRFRLPYDYDLTLRKIAFFRHNLIDKAYPLDSALFISIENLYRWHKLEPQIDEACTGLFMFDKTQASFMKDIFYKYDRNVESLTNNGEQVHVNYEFQNTGNVKWLPYSFQALWVYEIANHYPFLFSNKYLQNKELVNDCIYAVLSNRHFLHFPGSWPESSLWKLFNASRFNEPSRQDFINYSALKLLGEPQGHIRPNSKNKES